MSMKNKPAEFYVYLHRRKSDGRIFYVGKGHGERAHGTHGRSQKWQATYLKHGLVVEIRWRFPTESEAFAQERLIIQRLRGLGASLANLTDGGEGMAGYQWTPEQRKALTEAQRATWARPGYKERHREAQALVFESVAYKLKQSEAMKKRWADPAYQPRPLRHAENGRARAVKCLETGTVFDSISLATVWLQSIGVSSASRTRIVACCRGHGRSAYGYHWHYAEHALTEAEIAWRLEGYVKGSRHYRARAVRCMETETVFSTVTEAAAWVSKNAGGASSSEMSACCNFEQRHIRGLHFHFEDTPPTAEQLAWMHEGRPSGARSHAAVAVACVETGEKFETVTAAVRWLRSVDYPKATVANVLNCAKYGKPRYAYGHHWKLV